MCVEEPERSSDWTDKLGEAGYQGFTRVGLMVLASFIKISDLVPTCTMPTG